jgi:hypothetical protein
MSNRTGALFAAEILVSVGTPNSRPWAEITLALMLAFFASLAFDGRAAWRQKRRDDAERERAIEQIRRTSPPA